MKILFLNYEYPPLGGGAGNATAYLLREYAKVPGLEVHLVTSAVGTEYVRETVGDRIVIHRLPIGKDPNRLSYQSRNNLLTYSWKAYFFSENLIGKEGGFDLIHAFFTVPCGFLALILGLQYRLPYIISLRGADVPGYSERFRALYGFLRPLVRVIWRHAVRVISNSAGLRDLARKTDSGLEIPIIPNGVSMDEFSLTNRQTSDGVVRVLTVSRLTPRKGIRFLIRAMVGLPKHIRLIIVGEGDERHTLESIADSAGVSDRVEFRGLIPHEELPAIYREADIFCLPSLNEGMSNTMLEAIASGLPIVATITGGTEELVTNGRNGYFVQTSSSDDLADKLGILAADPVLRARMGEVSRAKAESMSWHAVASDYVDEYHRSISR
jgi:glycosyltransferase involved in cell wall biosynthesis